MQWVIMESIFAKAYHMWVAPARRRYRADSRRLRPENRQYLERCTYFLSKPAHGTDFACIGSLRLYQAVV